MAASSPVLLDREVFHELLQRSDCIAASDNGSEREFETAVLVPQGDYDTLQLIAHHFVNLRDNLRNGGLDDDAFRSLCFAEGEDVGETPPLQAPAQPYSDGMARKHSIASSTETGQSGHVDCNVNTNGSQKKRAAAAKKRADEEARLERTQSNDYQDSIASIASLRIDSGASGTTDTRSDTGSSSNDAHAERTVFRTVQLANLSDSTTLADVADAVRGGQLAELYIRHLDRSAIVSFVHAPDALRFFDHVRKHDLYIKTRRIQCRWADRQFSVTHNIRAQVNAGATRNLVIVRCDPRVTENLVRGDLEHIRNLDVIRIRFASGNCHIQCNSVHNALAARTHLMSRGAYKSSRIEWGADECAGPLPVIAPVARPKKIILPYQTPNFAAPNRFQALKTTDGSVKAPSKMPSSEDSEDSEDDEGVVSPMP